MTVQEVYDAIVATQADHLITPAIYRFDFWDIIEKAVLKEIPKAPIWRHIYRCGACGMIIGANYGCIEYCHDCGQCIDWEAVDGTEMYGEE